MQLSLAARLLIPAKLHLYRNDSPGCQGFSLSAMDNYSKSFKSKSFKEVLV